MKMKFFALIIGFAFLASCNSDSKTYVTIETEYGNMVAELYSSTPKHKENFIKLTKEEFYDGLIFHRIIKGFMIQGGDPNSRGADLSVRLGSGGPGYKIDAEIGAPHFKGTLAAARTGGPANPEKKSSGSQFYVVQGNPISDAQLDSFEKQKNIKYNAEQRAKYKTLGGTPALDVEYTVFGEIISGLDVIDKIAEVSKDGERPLENVVMKVRMGK
ncbi:MAG: cyclophilin family peptidyl-prolyl cis-trans isomerase [Saprospiraceae bacterium]|jgi:cyclophilin family peptidyl-prolyl cis-trans isomerase